MSDVEVGNLFQLPEDYQVHEKQGTVIIYDSNTVGPIDVTLIGSSPLYGHILTHAAKSMAQYLEENPLLVRNKNVLEFGAGGGLPSLISGKLGATCVVISDYPDADLVNNIQHNIEENGLDDNCTACGFIWGNDATELVEPLPDKAKFDVILLADVIFNHSEHFKLLQSCRDLLTPGTGQILVTFSPHRPKLFTEDLAFFDRAQEEPYGFSPELIELQHWSPLFKDDRDEETKELRSRVYLYVLKDGWGSSGPV